METSGRMTSSLPVTEETNWNLMHCNLHYICEMCIAREENSLNPY